MANKRYKVALLLDVSEEATKEDVKGYVEAAVQSWCGSLVPDDPMCDVENVEVTSAIQTRTPR